MTNQPPNNVLPRKAWFAIAIAIVPFFAKRAILLGEHNYVFWLAADYGARILSLVGVEMARRSGLFAKSRAPAGALLSVVTFVILLALELNLQVLIYPLLRSHLNYLELSHFPAIPNALVQSFDFYFGLFLVALSEESVFRALLITTLERWQIK